MKKTIVLYPGLAVSHFVPMMLLADVLLEEGYTVVVALIDIIMEQNIAFAAAVDRAKSSKPSITFHVLPRVQNLPTIAQGAQLLLRYLKLLRRYNKHLHEFLCSTPPRSIHAVIVDTLSIMALDITKELGIPAYSLFPSNLHPRRLPPAFFDQQGGTTKLQGARRHTAQLSWRATYAGFSPHRRNARGPGE
uniref:Uncharacterized protein n=1 Tax=Arundo donax TaxID=35708 RepID=A0A0A9PYU9_ARUDO